MGTGDGAGDGDGTGDGTGDGAERGQRLADIVSGGTGGGMRTVRTEKAGLADIGAMYNPSMSFAENMAALNNARKKDETGDLYSGGGMIQNIDLTDEIDRLLRGY